MRILRFQISAQLLSQALRLPKGAVIFEMRPTQRIGDFDCKVTSEDFPDVPEGGLIPEVTPTLTQETHDCGHDTVTWEWGI